MIVAVKASLHGRTSALCIFTRRVAALESLSLCAIVLFDGALGTEYDEDEDLVRVEGKRGDDDDDELVVWYMERESKRVRVRVYRKKEELYKAKIALFTTLS